MTENSTAFYFSPFEIKVINLDDIEAGASLPWKEEKLIPVSFFNFQIIEWSNFPDFLVTEKDEKLIGVSIGIGDKETYSAYFADIVNNAKSPLIKYIRSGTPEHDDRYHGFGDNDILELFFSAPDENYICHYQADISGDWLFSLNDLEEGNLGSPKGFLYPFRNRS